MNDPARRLETEFEDAERSPGLLMWRATNAWQAAQRAALKPHGLTHAQFVLLASLVWLDHEGPVTQRVLAEHAGTDPMTTSQVLRALESADLVERRRHPTDARARALVPTAEGVATANRAVAVVEEVDRRFFEPLGDRVGLLTELLAAVSGAGGSADRA